MRFIEQEDVNVLNFLPSRKVAFPNLSGVLSALLFVVLLGGGMLVSMVIQNALVQDDITKYSVSNQQKQSLFLRKTALMDERKGRYIATVTRAYPYKVLAFSAPMRALSSTYLGGLWLNDVQIDNRNNEVTIKGGSYNASDLSRFLSLMNNTRYFSGKKLALIKMFGSGRGQDLQLKSQPLQQSLASKLNATPKVEKVTAQAVGRPLYFFEVSNVSHASVPGLQQKLNVGSKLILPKFSIKR